MKLMIEIDEPLYKLIYSDAEIMVCGGMRIGKTLFVTLLRAVRNGTPLPKGHGRLTEIDKITLDDIGFFSIGDYQKMVRKLTSAPTIIPADKEDKE